MRSFGLVEDKIYEADFFLEEFDHCSNFFTARYYLSAFVSAARSVTFAMQASLHGHPGFSDWYEQQRQRLQSDATARFFVQARNEAQKIGIYHIDRGVYEAGHSTYFFQDPGNEYPDKPIGDMNLACRRYLTILVQIVYDCFKEYGPVIDPDQYYTLTNLERLGRTLEDIEEELGLPKGYTAVLRPERRILALRGIVPPTYIDEAFIKYLGRTRFQDDTGEDSAT